MKILLIGCTGFLGKNLVRLLARQGHECVVLTRSSRSISLPESVKVAPYADPPDQVDAVISLVGEPVAGRWTTEKKKKILDSRVDSTRHWVTWMGSLKTPPRVFLCASAVGIYGDRGNETLTEDSMPDPQNGFLADVCKKWEAEANRAVEFGTRVVNLRISNVMDPTGGFLKALAPMLKLSPFYIPTAPKAYLPWISLVDCVEAMKFALVNDTLSGPVNLVSPTAITNLGFYKALGKARRRLVLGFVPDFAIRTLLGEFADAVIGSQHILPERLVQAGFKFQDPNLTEFLTRRFQQSGPDPRM